jgi:hypothetical protein
MPELCKWFVEHGVVPPVVAKGEDEAVPFPRPDPRKGGLN